MLYTHQKSQASRRVEFPNFYQPYVDKIMSVLSCRLVEAELVREINLINTTLKHWKCHRRGHLSLRARTGFAKHDFAAW